MARMMDEDLIRIVHHGEDEGYEPAAVAAASAEMARRNLAQPDVSKILDEVEQSRGIEDTKHLIPLRWGGRILFALLGPLWIVMIGAVILRQRGYVQKSNDAWLSILAGFGIYAAVATLLAMMG